MTSTNANATCFATCTDPDTGESLDLEGQSAREIHEQMVALAFGAPRTTVYDPAGFARGWASREGYSES